LESGAKQSGRLIWTFWEGTFGPHLHGKISEPSSHIMYITGKWRLGQCCVLSNGRQWLWERLTFYALKMEAADCSKKLVTRYQTVHHLIAEGHSPNSRFCENPNSYIVTWCHPLTEIERQNFFLPSLLEDRRIFRMDWCAYPCRCHCSYLYRLVMNFNIFVFIHLRFTLKAVFETLGFGLYSLDTDSIIKWLQIYVIQK
jgi:hypothetical protein